MTIRARQFTAEELLRMPDDGSRCEPVGGESRKSVPAGGEHGYLALEVAAELRNRVPPSGPGGGHTAATGFEASSDRGPVRAPDAAFAAPGHAQEAGRVRCY